VCGVCEFVVCGECVYVCVCVVFLIYLFNSMPHYTVILHALHNLRCVCVWCVCPCSVCVCVWCV